MYALNIDKETGRILSATYSQYAPADAVTVDGLPDGNISDYLYSDDGYVYDPLPVEERAEDAPTQEERIADLEEALALLLSGVTE